MSSPPSHPIRDTVIGTLIAAAILSLVATVIPGGWTWVFRELADFRHWSKGTVNVALWLLILVIVADLTFFSIAVLWALERIFKSDSANAITDEGVFDGIRWRWRYGQHGVSDLAAFCPDCDLQIRPQGDRFGVKFNCEDCGKTLQTFDRSYSDVQNMVIRKIQKTMRKERE